MQRNDVGQVLWEQGVDQEEARARVQAVSDEEIRAAAAKLPELPAGQGLSSIVGTAVFIFVVLPVKVNH